MLKKCKKMQDIKLYVMNVASFTIASLDWLEPALEIILLLLTIGYTLNKWYILKKKKIIWKIP